MNDSIAKALSPYRKHSRRSSPSDLSPIVLEIKEAFAMILFCGTLIGFFWISILVLAGFFS